MLKKIGGACILWILAFKLNAALPTPSPEELFNLAEGVYIAQVDAKSIQKECINDGCTIYRLRGNAIFNVIRTLKGPNVNSFLQAKYLAGLVGPVGPGPQPHDPQPSIGQVGTLFIDGNGNIYAPNGWMPISGL